MMDGRIGYIRSKLDEFNHKDTSSYPMLLSTIQVFMVHFGMVGSKPIGESKSSYQMNIANSDEALHEVGRY